MGERVKLTLDVRLGPDVAVPSLVAALENTIDAMDCDLIPPVPTERERRRLYSVPSDDEVAAKRRERSRR